jgi:hypothetical protein
MQRLSGSKRQLLKQQLFLEQQFQLWRLSVCGPVWLNMVTMLYFKQLYVSLQRLYL